MAGSLAVGLVGHPRRVYLLGAVLGFGASLGLTALAPNAGTACVTLLLTGFAGYLFVTTASTALQLHAAPQLRGRVMALWIFVYLGTAPLGSVLAGWLSSAAGPRAVLWAGSASCAVGAVFAALVRTPPHVDDGLVEVSDPR